MSAQAAPALVEAAAWRTRLAEANLESSPAFEEWLRADEQNAVAWQQAQAPWNLLGEQATAPEVLELRRAALAHAQSAGSSRWGAHSRRTGWLSAAAVLLVTLSALWVWQQTRPDIYRTAAGERRVVTLVDGSQIALDSSSEVAVKYSPHARELALSSGQARFDVAHDVTRPFSVSARGHKVIATGTAFNVDLFGPSLLVTLIEGHVLVISETTAAPIRVAEIGEQLVISPTAPPSVEHVNVQRAVSWENGEIIFENDPLSTVVARLNRYARKPVVIADPSTSELRISGVFHTGDIDGFVSTIVSYLPVDATKNPEGATLLTHR